MQRWWKATVLAAAMIAAHQAWGADAPMKVEIRAFKEVVFREDGVPMRQLVPPKGVTPGDVIVYVVRYRNGGRKPAEHVRIEDPLPAGVAYVPGSMEAPGARTLFSVDGRHYAPEGRVRVRDAKTGKRRPARPDEYRFIRWELAKPVPPRGEGSFRFRVRVR